MTRIMMFTSIEAPYLFYYVQYRTDHVKDALLL